MAAADDSDAATDERPGDGREDPARAQTQTADAETAMTGGAVDATRLPPVDPTRYHVVREFARGGLGRIIEVRDLRIGRVVALKEMLRDSDAAYARFVREATITARLEHPAIVPVHDIGRWPSGEPFYSMKLVSGRSLHEVIRDTPELDGRLALLPNVIAVADAIAYAHSQGIIHRDLKPANVLVGAFGETVVIDWGLAKDLRATDGETTLDPATGGDSIDTISVSSDGGLTVAGSVLGTPCYMPPEQASGRPVDPRADVYAIGALLYEVLAGEPPYRHAPEVLAAVLAGPPASVEEIEPAIPPELAAIAKKAMARKPEDRYPSARELAEDLRRFQTGRLVSAHAYSRGTLVKRWLRRYRAPVIVAAAALTILAVVGVVSVERVIAERDVARRRANELLLTQASGALQRDPTESVIWLRAYPEGGEDWAQLRTLAIDAESRGVARHVPRRDGFFAFTADGREWIGAEDGEHLDLHDATTGALVRQLPHRGRVARIDALPDGRTLAVLNEVDAAVALVDLSTGAAHRLPGHPAAISEMAVSPDGKWIASGSLDGLVRLDSTGSVAGRELRGHTSGIYWVAFSRDSRRLLSIASERVAVRIWDVAGGTSRTLTDVRDIVAGDISPDGALVALTHQDGAVTLWSTETGKQVRSLGRHAGKPSWVVFSPDGRWVVSVGDDGLIRVTATAGEAQRTLSGHTGAVTGIAFSPDGRLIASGGSDGEVRLWQVDGDEERVLGRHPGHVFYLAFSPDGRRLVSRTNTGGKGFDARIWDVATLQRRGLRCHRATIFRLALTADGRRMATGSEDNGVCLWDPRTGESRRLDGHEGIVFSIAFSPDGSRLASASFDGTVRLWDLGACTGITGCEPAVRKLEGHRGQVWTVEFSPDGRKLVSAGSDATVRIWDVASGEARILAGHTRIVRWVVFSPDGRYLATAGEEHEPRLWDLATGTGTPLRGHGDRITAMTFSRDGRALWTSSLDQTVRRWDVATRESRVLAQRLGGTPTFALSPDGRSLAVGLDDRVVLVDPATGAQRVLGRHGGTVTQLAFSPDGARLSSASRSDHTVRLWDVGGELLEAVFQHEFEVFSHAFSPDGRWIAAAGSGSVVRLWPTPSSGLVPREPSGLAAWLAALSTAALPSRDEAP